MKKLLFTIIAILASNLLFAQAPNIQWQKCLGGSSDEYASDIQQTNDGGYIVVGYTSSNDGDVSGNLGGADSWIIKIDSIGNIQWQKNLGGINDDKAYAIQQTNDGGYIVAGYTESNDGDVSGNHGSRDAWVVRLDSIGNIEWQKCYGGSDADEAYSIQLTNDGGYIFAGYTESNDGDLNNFTVIDQNAWVVRLDSLGNIQWQRCYGGSQSDFAYSVKKTNDGGFVIASSDMFYFQNLYILKVNSQGNTQWDYYVDINENQVPFDIQQTTDGGYIIVGYHEDSPSPFWVVKLNSIGDLLWNKEFGGYSGNQYAYSVQQISDGGFIIAGFTGSDDGDVSGNHGGRDAWVIKLDNAGNLLWQKCLGGYEWDVAYSIKQTNDDEYIVAGSTQSNDGDVSGNHGGYDFWVVKLGPTQNTSINDIDNPIATLYPNPTNDIIEIKSPSILKSIELKDIRGKAIFTQKLNANQTILNLKNISNGMYFVELIDINNHKQVSKIIKQ